MPDATLTDRLTPNLAVSWQEPSQAKISPGGDRVAFVLSCRSKPDEHKRSSIWMARAMGDDTHQFTFGPRSDAAPDWSPDGGQLVFISDRREAGKNQLYIMSAGGGEARLLAEMKGGISTPAWSPDGRWVAFLATDETPEAEEQKPGNRDQIVADQNYKFERLYVVSGEGGDPICVSAEGAAHVSAYDWSPSSSALVVVQTPTPRVNDRAYGPCDLVVYSVDPAGEGRLLLHLDAGLYQPEWSPEEDRIAFVAASGRVQAPDSIWTVSASGGEPIQALRGYEGTVDHIAWSPSGDEIRFVGHEDLWGALLSLNLHSGELRSLLPEDERRYGSFADPVSFSGDGETYAIVRSTSIQPPEVYVGRVGSGIRAVTQLNPELASLRFSKCEPISWASSDGLPISGLIFRPLDYQEGDRVPLIVEVHGGPAWYWSDRFMGDWHDWVQLLAARGFAVLLPNPRGSTGRGAAFTDMEVNDMGGMELADILTGVDYVVSMGFVDPDRIGIGGWSHGGYLSSWAVTQTHRFKAAVVGAGVSNMLSDEGQNDIPGFNVEYFDQTIINDPMTFWRRSPLAYVQNVRTPTLILHGEKDERVTQPQGQELYRALKRLGVEVEFVTYPREGHPIQEKNHQLDLMDRMLRWFEHYVKQASVRGQKGETSPVGVGPGPDLCSLEE